MSVNIKLVGAAVTEKRLRMKLILIALAFVSAVISARSETHSLSPLSLLENDVVPVPVAAAKRSSSPQPQPQPLMVPLTLIQGAASKGAGESQLNYYSL